MDLISLGNPEGKTFFICQGTMNHKALKNIKMSSPSALSHSRRKRSGACGARGQPVKQENSPPNFSSLNYTHRTLFIVGRNEWSAFTSRPPFSPLLGAPRKTLFANGAVAGANEVFRGPMIFCSLPTVATWFLWNAVRVAVVCCD